MLPLGHDLWVSSTDEEVVQRVDPDSNSVTDTIDDAGPVPDGLFAFEGAVWVAADEGTELRRIDPRTLEVTGPWVVSDQGSISDNQLAAVVGATFWLPMRESGEVVSVRAPVGSF
jgi:streptogramin lyase